MKVIQRRDVTGAEWDAVVQSSSEAWLFHRSSWIDLEARFLGASDLSFALARAGQRLTAIVPLYESRIGLGPFVEVLLHSGFHRHAGPIFSADLPPEAARQAKALALAEILRIAAERDADRIHLAVQNLSPAALSQEREEVPFWVMEHGFAMGTSYGPAGFEPAPGLSTTMIDQIVDLRASVEVLFAALDESCRRAVRKATASGLTFKTMVSVDLDLYWHLAGRSAQRTGESLPSRDYYAAMTSARELSGHVHLHVGHLGERPVAALFTLEDKGGAHFLAGVSDPDALSMRVNDFLHWQTMLSCKSRGLRHYRLGPCFPTLPAGWPVETVTRFKKKFGARHFTVIQGNFFRKPWRYREIALRNIDRLCAGEVLS